MIQEEFKQLLSVYKQESMQRYTRFSVLEKSCSFFEQLKNALLTGEVSSEEAVSMLNALRLMTPPPSAGISKKAAQELLTPAEKKRRRQVLERLQALGAEIEELLLAPRPARAVKSPASKLRAQNRVSKKRWMRS